MEHQTLDSVDIAKIQYYKQMRERRIAIERDRMKAKATSMLGDEIKETSFEMMRRLQFLEVSPLEFYDSIFRDYLDITDEFNKGQYVGIVVERVNDNKIKRYSITDGLFELSSLIYSAQLTKNFCFMSCISYAGKSRLSKNARVLFALVIDLDNLSVRGGVPYGLRNLIYQIANEQLPKPTYIVCSGTGIHLYYVFDDPIPLYKNNVRYLNKIRKDIIRMVWNQYVTDSYKHNDIQWESLYQAFRVVGTYAKNGKDLCTAFRYGNGDTVSIEYLSSFISSSVDYVKKIRLLPKYSLEELREMYPDWTRRHFTDNGKRRKNPKKGRYYTNRALYDSYYKRLANEVQVGHRYHSLMALASLAQKCQADPDPEKRKNKPFVTRQEFIDDCNTLFDIYELKTNDENNHFTKKDLEAAINLYDKRDLVRMTVEHTSYISGITIERNVKRRPKNKQIGQSAHLNLIRQTRDILNPNWDEYKGKKTMAAEIFNWRINHPYGIKSQCGNELKINKNTVSKWWNYNLIEEIIRWKRCEELNSGDIDRCAYDMKCNKGIVENYWYYNCGDILYDTESDGSSGSAVKFWIKNNPEGSKYECIKATGLSKNTVYKWWKE